MQQDEQAVAEVIAREQDEPGELAAIGCPAEK
jgi:hypothetical protein